MKSVVDQVADYAAYHQDRWNKMTHFVGVPLVTFSLFLFLSWLRFQYEPEIPYTGATLFFFVVFLYYLRLDWHLALCQLPFSLGLLALADWIARWPSFWDSLLVFLTTFIGGWIIQLIGHVFEGKRPALADNILQIFNAPLFLTVEVLVALGYRQDLQVSLSVNRLSRG